MKRIYLLGYFHSGALADDLIELITEKLFKEALGKDILLMDKKSHPLPVKNISDFFNKNTDLVVFCGGSLLGQLRLYPFNKIESWIRELKVPLILLGTGWRREAKPLTTAALNKMELLLTYAKKAYVRGYKTLENIRRYNLSSGKVIPLGDPGLCYWDYPVAPVRVNKHNTIAIVVRWMEKIEILQDDKTISNEIFHKQLAKLLDYLIINKGIKIKFFPFSTKGRTHDDDYKGIASVKSFMESVERTFVYQPTGDLSDLVINLSEVVFVISQRLHGSLPCIGGGIPCMPIEYQFGKMEDSLSMPGFKGISKLVTPMSKVGIESFLNKKKELQVINLLQENVNTSNRIHKNYIKVIKNLF